MKLSMWTIFARLEAAGFDAVPSISEGLPRVAFFRRREAGERGAEYVELAPAGEGSLPGALPGDIALWNDTDYILVHGADALSLSACLGETFAFYARWESELLGRMVEGANLQELLDAAEAVFRRPMFIKNDSSWTFAITRGYPADVHPYWAEMEQGAGKRVSEFDTVRTVSTDPEFRSIFTERYPSVVRSPAYGAMILHANIFLGRRRAAEIVALENGVPFDRGEVHLMHSFAEMLERYLRAHSEILLAASDPAALLEALIEGRETDGLNLPQILRSAGLDPDEPLCAAVIEGRDRSETPMLAVLRDKLDGRLGRAAVFSHEKQVVCLLGLGEGEGCAQAAERLKRLIPPDAFLWGLSYEFTDLRALPEHYRLACAALEQAAEEGGKPFATVYDAACALMGRACAGVEEARRLIHPDIARLREADAREGAHYAETLLSYLLCGGNYTDTAARLGLHRNSLIYRMNKVRALMRTDPDELENRKLLLFSFFVENDQRAARKG